MSAGSALSRGRWSGLLLMSAGVLLLDQLSKAWVRQNFAVGQSVPLIDGVLHLTHVQNSGAAFGLFPNYTWFFIAATLLLFLLIFLNRKELGQDSRLMRFAYALALAGACGNFIDRVVFGQVTDFLDLRIWPIFNVADMAITSGIVLLGWCFLMQERSQSETPKGETLVERTEQTDGTNRTDGINRDDRIDDIDNIDRSERIDRIDRMDPIDRSERANRDDRMEEAPSDGALRP